MKICLGCGPGCFASRDSHPPSLSASRGLISLIVFKDTPENLRVSLMRLGCPRPIEDLTSPLGSHTSRHMHKTHTSQVSAPAFLTLALETVLKVLGCYSTYKYLFYNSFPITPFVVQA